MPRKKEARSETGCGCCEGNCGPGCGCGCQGAPNLECCQVAAVVSVDARGQMVLPKEVRQQLKIGPDEKLAVITWKCTDSPAAVALMKADSLAASARKALGPLLSQV